MGRKSVSGYKLRSKSSLGISNVSRKSSCRANSQPDASFPRATGSYSGGGGIEKGQERKQPRLRAVRSSELVTKQGSTEKALKQSEALLDFRNKVDELALIVDYEDVSEFEWRVRDDLFLV